PLRISRSVPQTPSAKVRTKTAPSDCAGSGTSSSLAEQAIPGKTVIARIAALDCLDLRSRGGGRGSFFGASDTPALRARLSYSSTQDGEKCSFGLKRKPGRRRYDSLMVGTIWRPLDAGDGQSRRAISPLKAPILT